MTTQTKPDDNQPVGNKATADKVVTPDQSPAQPNEPAQTNSGFEPFRLWLNRKIRALVGGPTLKHREVEYAVTEITPDGQIRLERGQQAVLVPFDEEVIQPLLEQLL